MQQEPAKIIIIIIIQITGSQALLKSMSDDQSVLGLEKLRIFTCKCYYVLMSLKSKDLQQK